MFATGAEINLNISVRGVLFLPSTLKVILPYWRRWSRSNICLHILTDPEPSCTVRFVVGNRRSKVQYSAQVCSPSAAGGVPGVRLHQAGLRCRLKFQPLTHEELQKAPTDPVLVQPRASHTHARTHMRWAQVKSFPLLTADNRLQPLTICAPCTTIIGDNYTSFRWITAVWYGVHYGLSHRLPVWAPLLLGKLLQNTTNMTQSDTVQYEGLFPQPQSNKST